MKQARRLAAAVTIAAGFAAAMPGVPAQAVPGDHDAPPCSAGEVNTTASDPDAAAGHRSVILVFVIAGATPCTLTGYPRVELSGGGPLDHARPTLRGYMGGLPAGVDGPPTVTLSPSQVAQSILESVADPGDGEPCPSYPELLVTPPGLAQAAKVPVALDGCQLQVHPVTPVTIEPAGPPPTP